MIEPVKPPIAKTALIGIKIFAIVSSESLPTSAIPTKKAGRLNKHPLRKKHPFDLKLSYLSFAFFPSSVYPVIFKNSHVIVMKAIKSVFYMKMNLS